MLADEEARAIAREKLLKAEHDMDEFVHSNEHEVGRFMELLAA